MNINYCANSMIYNNKWSDTVTEYGLIQLIKYPTRVTKSSSSIIDHIYASDVISLSEVFVTDLSIRDHCPICATIPLHSYQKNSNAHTNIHTDHLSTLINHYFRLICTTASSYM